MKKTHGPVKLPPLIVSGSIRGTIPGRKLSVKLRYMAIEHGKKLRSRDKSARARAAHALAEMIKSKNCLIDSIDALRVLGKEARGKNLEATHVMVREFGQRTYRESVECTAKTNQTVTHAATFAFAAIATVSIYTGSLILIIPSIAGLLAAGCVSLISQTKAGAQINLLKMSPGKAMKILKNINK